MSTQVPPSRLDSTKDFSSLVPSAFAQANAAFAAANSASGAAATSTPRISSIVYPGDDTAAATAGGQTVTLNGAGFNAGASVLINGSYAGVVSVANSTSLSFTTPSNSGGTYILYVINTDGGTGISVPGISYSGTPSWSNTSGSLATLYETAAVNTQLTATGGVSDGAITYSLQSGTLPSGSSLNSSTGLLSGTSQATASSTTYSFTIRASDAQNQDTDRAFSITINPDAVTWSSPADGTVTELFQDTAMSNVTLSATSAAGQSIAYTANALPTGVTISGSNVTGTPTVVGNTISVITATAANTNRTATRTFTWVVSVSSDPYFKNTTLLLNGEGASANNGSNNNIFIDSSNNNYAITRAGNATQGSFSPYSVTGWSNYFDGTGDYFSFSTISLDANFTVEMWIYPTSYPGTYHQILSSGSANFQFLITGGTISLFNFLNHQTTISLNRWYHIALVRSGSSINLYVDGVKSTSTYSSATTYTPTNIGTYTGASEFFAGYISNLRIVKGTALYTSTFTPSTTPLTAITNTSLLTCQSNRFIDNSPNSLTLTKAGDVSVQAFDPFGSVPEAVPISYSTYLNGSSYVTVPSTSADSLFGSGNYTVEFWTKTDDTSWEMIAPEAGVGLALIIASGNLILQNQYGQAGILTVSASSILNGAWHHVAVVRNSGTITIYFDGTSVGTVSNSTDYSNQTLTYDIGYGNQSAGRYLTGKLSNFRIVNGTAVYTSNFTPPSTPLTNITNTKVLTFQNPTLIDNSSSARSLGVSGTQNIFIDNPFGYTTQSATSYTPSLHGGSAYFDGTGDYISFPNSSAFAFGTGSFTIEFWINAPLNNNKFILSGRGGITSLHITTGGYNGVTTAGALRYGSTDIGTSVVVCDNTWHHCAIVRNGSSAVTMYVDGVSRATTTDSTNYTTTTGTWYIATNDSGPPSEVLTGYLSNFRIVKGTAVYTSNFTPPTTPLTPIANTSLLLNFTNAGIIDQHGTNVIETVGNAQLSTSVKKYGSASMYFDGTGDYIYQPSSINYGYGTGNFTIEFWLYLNSTGLQTILSHLASNPQVKPHIYYSSGVRLYINGSDVITGGTVTISTWTHIALVRNSGSTRLYINGTQSGSTYTDSNNYGTSSPLIIGDYSVPVTGTNMLNGYIDDLRITKGYARYTSNFTPPSALSTK